METLDGHKTFQRRFQGGCGVTLGACRDTSTLEEKQTLNVGAGKSAQAIKSTAFSFECNQSKVFGGWNQHR